MHAAASIIRRGQHRGNGMRLILLATFFFSDFVLALGIGASLSFEVLDAISRGPIPGVRVTIGSELAESEGITDSFGKCTFALRASVKAGTVLHVFAEGKGFEPQHVELEYRGGTERIFLVHTRNPDSARTAFRLGETLRDQQKWRDAHEAFSQAIALDDHYAEAYRERCNADNQLGRFHEAVADCTHAIALGKRNSITYNNRGFAHDHLGEFTEALDDLLTGLSLEPHAPTILNNLALTFWHLGCLQQAQQTFTEAIERRPGYPLYDENLGALLVDMRQYDLARTMLIKSEMLDPDRWITHYHLGRLYNATGQYQRAIQELNKAIAGQPAHAGSYFERAFAKQALGDDDGAAADRSTAKHLNYKPTALVAVREGGCPTIPRSETVSSAALNGK